MSLGLLNKSILKISGTSSKELLNSLITQDINNLTKQTPIYTLFLNNKGRVLFSSIIYELEENSYALEIAKEKLMDLAQHIHKYDLTKETEFSQLEDYCIAISHTQQDLLYKDPRNQQLPFRGIIKKDESLNFNQPIDQEYENLRLKLTIPEDFDFIYEKSLANDLNLEELNGISFNKGCYLGQEMSSRTKHIKSTKNRLITLNNNRFSINNYGCDIYNNEDLVGKSFSYNGNYALAIIKRNITDLSNLTIK